MTKKPINKNHLTIILSILIFCIVLLLQGLFYSNNKTIQSLYFTIKNTFNSNYSKEIVIIEIDEKTLNNLGGFPFSRDKYTKVIDNLTSASAGVISFDLFFSDAKDALIDNDLADSIKKSNRVIFGLPILESGVPEMPTQILKESILSSGYVRANLDVRTNKVFSFNPYFVFNDGESYEHFSIVSLKAFYSSLYEKDYLSSERFYDNSGYFITDNIKVPYSSEYTKEILINFIEDNLYTSFSFYDIYDDSLFSKIPSDFFKGKIVLIGTTAKGLNDTVSTANGIIPGVYLHANILNTILTKTYLTYFDKNLEYLLLFLLIVISVHFNINKRGFFLIVSNLIISSFFLIFFPIFIILNTNLIINFPTELIFALIFSLITSNIIKYLTELKNKQKLNKALSEYVSEDIATEILSGIGNVNLEGEKKYITIFFSDIEGFTNISEILNPEELLDFLKEYVRIMSNIILDENGFINKYEGDGIMALWGAFSRPSLDYEYEACKSALLQIKALDEINEKFKEKNIPEIKIRIGINSGEAIIGNIGIEGRKKEFTALGDSVNIASRLEGVNKFFGTNIIISEYTYQKVKDYFDFRLLGKIRVKGKQNTISVFELIGFKGEADEKRLSLGVLFEKALDYYYARDFKKALDLFKKLSKLGDLPSSIYKIKCLSYIKSEPGENFDFSISFSHK